MEVTAPHPVGQWVPVEVAASHPGEASDQASSPSSGVTITGWGRELVTPGIRLPHLGVVGCVQHFPRQQIEDRQDGPQWIVAQRLLSALTIPRLVPFV